MLIQLILRTYESIVLKRAEDDSAWLIASLQSCKFIFCKIYNTVNYRTILCHVHLRLQSHAWEIIQLLSSVLLRGKGGKLQGKGDANRYGKVFSDRPPLLEVHAVVAEAYGCCVFPRRCLLCRVSSPVGVRRANNIFPARFVFIEAVRPPQ